MKRHVVQVTCDLCGKVLTDHDIALDPGFAVGGVSYELDLCSDHAEDLASKLAPFVAVGHKEARRGRPSGGGRRPSPRKAAAPDLRAVREWAEAHGYRVSTRGRIPAEVLSAYESNQGGAQASASSARAPRAAKRSSQRSGGGRGGAGRGSGPDTKAVREWARAQGHQVGDRGRIPAELIAQYQASLES